MQTDDQVDTVRLAAKVLQAMGTDMDFYWANAHPDLVLEFPYAPSLGWPERVAGREAIEQFLADLGGALPGLSFSDIQVTPLADGEGVLMEYRGSAQNYDQRYITVARFRDGKLILFREYFDTTEAARALSAGGS
ncbi:nuclear transport factor 2 family protein (plasmid) [Mycolicibacterium psychrotolerans]|uniref:nuclear transport factor 2 family protein n=1 Tax=Mycolicibacterium psychrotolerans TaxID=216929 RepID=UPI003D66A62E